MPLGRAELGTETVFQDLHLTIEDVIEQDDKVVVRSKIAGTEKETFFGEDPFEGGTQKIGRLDCTSWASWGNESDALLRSMPLSMQRQREPR
jgi:hypothetical protein